MAKIAIVGAGVIGETILSALLRAGYLSGDVVITEKREERAAELSEKYGVEALDNMTATSGADTIMLVVKPQDVPAVLTEISPGVRAGTTVMSLAAGVTIATMEQAFDDGVAIIRVMPNTPALVGEGMFGVSPGSSCSPEQLETALALLRPSGKVLVVDEAQQDAVTAVSGSGPAYVFLVAESMIAAGVEAGLSPEVAHDLTIQTIVGSAKLLADSDDTPDELRRRVTSPNGTTAAALAVLEQRELRAAFSDAVGAAKARSQELS